jgi:hypothetical protein
MACSADDRELGLVSYFHMARDARAVTSVNSRDLTTLLQADPLLMQRTMWRAECEY